MNTFGAEIRTVRQLVAQSKRYYAGKHLRREWIIKTRWLEQAGKHAKFTGGYAIEGAQNA